MAQKTNSFERFWKELKRRKVIHVITVYAAIAFVILQLIDIVSEPLRLPVSTKALVIVLLCIGFIIAVFVSWVYDITPAGVKKTKPVSAVKHTDQTTRAVSSGWKIATYVSGAIIIALVAFNFISKRNLNADLSKLEKSIAVLPFINDSPSDSNQYFINGIMEEVLNNLQKIKDFRILSRTSTDQYKGPDRPTIPEIAKKLVVNYIVEGSGQKYGNKFVLRVQLIAANNERHLWAKSYEKEIKATSDQISLQSEIAQSIATELKVIITPNEKQLIEKIPTTNLTAYDFYQRGREEERKYSLTNFTALSTGAFYKPSNKQAVERAEKMYNTALKYDSTFALAYIGLASVYWNKHFYEQYFLKSFLDSVLFLSKKALYFDNQLTDAYYIRGRYYAEKGLIKQALEEYDKALKFNPNNWLAYFGKGDLISQDDPVETIKNLQKAASLNYGSELPLIIVSLTESYFDTGFIEKANNNLEYFKLIGDSTQYLWIAAYGEIKQGYWGKAIEFNKKGYAIDSTDVETLDNLGYCHSFLGQFEESLKYYKKYVERKKALGQFYLLESHRIGYAYFKNGYKKEAEYYFDKQIDYCNDLIKSDRPWAQLLYPYYDLAGVYAFRGDKVKAYKNLKIFNQRQKEYLWMVSLIKTDPLFDSIRNEPEFQQIIGDVESKYQAEHERVRKWLEENHML